MIKLDNVTKSYVTKVGRKYVLKQVSLELPSHRNIAIMGRNGAGKSTLMKLIGGQDFPDSGRITSDVSCSWPLGLSSGHPQMTGRETTRFVARIHGVPHRKLEQFVCQFSELGKYFDLEIRTYSSGMRARLNFGISMAFDFDVYLLDEITSVGDPKFKEKAQEYLDMKTGKANVIMISHAIPQVRQLCDMGLIIDKGALTLYDDIEEAIEKYKSL